MKVQDLQQYYPEYYKFLLKYFPNSDWSQETFNEKDLREFYKKHPKVFKEGDGSHPDMTIDQCNEVLNLIPASYAITKAICSEGWGSFCYHENYFGVYSTESCHITNPIPYQVWLNYLGVELKDEGIIGELNGNPVHDMVHRAEKGAGDDYPVTEFAMQDECELTEKNIESAVKSIGRQKLKSEMQDWEKEISTKIITECPLISEHQKRMLEQYNPNPQTLSGGLEMKWSELTLSQIIEFEKKLLLSRTGVYGEGADIALKELNRQALIIGQLKSKMKHLNLNQFSGTSREVFNLVNQLVK